MRKEYCGNLESLFAVFGDEVSASDIVASKVLAEVSSAIARHRLEMGMTQKQFAQYMNVSQGMVSKWESADYNFSVKALAEIADKLALDFNIQLQKPREVCMPEVKQYSCISAIDGRVFVANNHDAKRTTHSFWKHYVETGKALKVAVK